MQYSNLFLMLQFHVPQVLSTFWFLSFSQPDFEFCACCDVRNYPLPSLTSSQFGTSLIGFLSELLVFAKNERIMREWAIRSLTLFWWSTWAIRSHCSFLVIDLSDLLTPFIKTEGMSDEWMREFPTRRLAGHSVHKVIFCWIYYDICIT